MMFLLLLIINKKSSLFFLSHKKRILSRNIFNKLLNKINTLKNKLKITQSYDMFFHPISVEFHFSLLFKISFSMQSVHFI